MLRAYTNVALELVPELLVARVPVLLAAVRDEEPRRWLGRQVEVAGALAEAGAAVVPPSRGPVPAGPHARDGFAITFWEHVRLERRERDQAAVGRSLRELHEHLRGYDGSGLPPLDPLAEAGALLDRLTDADLARRAVDHVRPKLDLLHPARPIHGDAHGGNALTPAGGGLLWSDWDFAGRGPVEWDVACLIADDIALGTARAALEPYLDGYGRDGFDAALVDALLDLRSCQILIWSEAMAIDSPALRPSVEQRRAHWRAKLGR